MNTTTTTAAPATAKKPVQFTFGITENLKNEATELRKGFTRPAAVAKAPPVPMSEKECFEVLYKVATDRRFKTVPVMESVEVDGEAVEVQALDEDGNPVFETKDLIGEAWEAIKVRDYSETVSKTPTIDGLVNQIRKYGAALGLSEDAIAAMVATATAPATAAE